MGCVCFHSLDIDFDTEVAWIKAFALICIYAKVDRRAATVP